MMANTNESCKNCKRRYRLRKNDYSQGGCEHSDMEGYVCMCLSREGIAEWMVGLNDEDEICECYSPKEDKL